MLSLSLKNEVIYIHKMQMHGCQRVKEILKTGQTWILRQIPRCKFGHKFHNFFKSCLFRLKKHTNLPNLCKLYKNLDPKFIKKSQKFWLKIHFCTVFSLLMSFWKLETTTCICVRESFFFFSCFTICLLHSKSAILHTEQLLIVSFN